MRASRFMREEVVSDPEVGDDGSKNVANTNPQLRLRVEGLFAVPSQPSEREPTARFEKARDTTQHSGSVSCHALAHEEGSNPKMAEPTDHPLQVVPLTRETLAVSATSGDSGDKLRITSEEFEIRAAPTQANDGGNNLGVMLEADDGGSMMLEADDVGNMVLEADDRGSMVLKADDGGNMVLKADDGGNMVPEPSFKASQDDLTTSPPPLGPDTPAEDTEDQSKQVRWAQLREVGGNAVAAVEASREELAAKEELAAAVAVREVTAGAILSKARVTLFGARFQRKVARRAARDRALQLAERFVQQQKNAAGAPQSTSARPDKCIESAAGARPDMCSEPVAEVRPDNCIAPAAAVRPDDSTLLAGTPRHSAASVVDDAGEETAKPAGPGAPSATVPPCADEAVASAMEEHIAPWVSQAARKVYAKELIRYYFVYEYKETRLALAQQHAAARAVAEEAVARAAIEQEVVAARETAKDAMTTLVANDRLRQSLPPSYFHLPELLRELIETSFFVSHARHRCAIDLADLELAAIALSGPGSSLDVGGKGGGKSGGTTITQSEQAAREFELLPKKTRDTVTQVSHMALYDCPQSHHTAIDTAAAFAAYHPQVVDMAKCGEVPILKVLRSDPLELAPTDPDIALLLIVQALCKGRPLPAKASEPWRWTEWWAPALAAGSRLGDDFSRGLLRASAEMSRTSLNIRSLIGGHRPTALLRAVPLLVHAVASVDLRDNQVGQMHAWSNEPS